MTFGLPLGDYRRKMQNCKIHTGKPTHNGAGRSLYLDECPILIGCLDYGDSGDYGDRITGLR